MSAGSRDRLGAIVLGMHRSGTSAASRVLSLLGFSLGPEAELLPANDGNPTGYWESAPLVEMNDELLLALGGHWSAPPWLEEGWEERPELASLRPAAADLLHSTLTAEQWAWKDPRLCLTLPFWSDLAQSRLVLLLVHRNPLEVAASLRARDGSPIALGLALWERYVRGALAVAGGRPVFVMSYERLLGDPAAWCSRLADFLRACGGEISATPLDGVKAFVRSDLRHATFDAAALHADSAVSEEMRAIQAALDDASGPHASFALSELPPETGWVEPLLAERRRALSLERQAHDSARQAHESRTAQERAEAALAAVESSRSYRALGVVRALAGGVEQSRVRLRRATGRSAGTPAPPGATTGEHLPERGGTCELG